VPKEILIVEVTVCPTWVKTNAVLFNDTFSVLSSVVVGMKYAVFLEVTSRLIFI
jgi:hypothetical protein